MIMTPTLVFPDDEVVKIDKHKGEGGEYDRAPRFSYQFNCTAGSAMRWALCTYTNIRTGEQNYSYFPKGGDINTFYNGDKVDVNELVFNDIAKNGHDYMYQYTLFQTDPTTIADDTQYGDGVGLYDMYFCRGKIQSSGTTSSFMINKEIANLKSAYYYERSDGSVYLVGGAYIEIGEERRLIETYDYKTGNVRLKSGFTTAPARGTVFRIFTNYFMDKPHYVKCREDPQCDFTVSISSKTANPIECKTSYRHPNHVGLKYYKYYLYQLMGTTGAIHDGKILETSAYNYVTIEPGIADKIVGKYIMIESSPSESTGHVYNGTSALIVSYDIDTGVAGLNYSARDLIKGSRYTIYNGNERLIDESDEIYDFELKYSFYANCFGSSFRAVSEIMTLDDKMYRYTQQKDFPAESIDGIVSEFDFKIFDNHTAMLTWKTSKSLGVAKIFRQNVNDDEYVFIGTATGNSFFDVTVGNQQSYIYYICYANYEAYITPEVSTDWIGWSIYSLKTAGDCYNKKLYSINETWHFIAGINNNDIISNIGLTVHTGTGVKLKTTRTVTNYESGEFTANHLTLACPEDEIVDTIDSVKSWTKFITGKNDFMLKSDKGDVWIVNISDNPSRSYDESSVYDLTTIKYNWVEVEDINDVIITR